MFNKEKKDCGIRFFAVLLLGWLSLGWIDPTADKIRDGNQSYRNGKYDEAYGRYAGIQESAPGLPQVDFNMADALYKKGKFDEAARLFQKVAGSDNTELQAKSSYNVGNTMYKQGKMKESLEWYKKALDAIEETPSTLNNDFAALRNDVKYNYEYVDKKMKEMEQKKQDKDQNEQKEDDKQKKEDKQSGKNDKDNQKDKEPQKENDPEKKEDQQQQQQQQQQQKEEDKKEQNQRPEKDKQKEQTGKQQQQLPQNPDQKQMTKEAAEQLLDAINQSEKEARNIKKEEQKRQHRSVEKDW